MDINGTEQNNTSNGHKNEPTITVEQDSKGRILLVDDDPGIVRMLGLTLKRFGYTVLAAQSGHEALEKVESFEPDLIILDVMMPDMSGIEVCQRLRSNSSTSRIPILMLSAKSRDVDKAAGFYAGADDYLEKPVGVKALLARVEGVLLRARYLPQQSGTIIAILGAKGGVGATSLAVNLGAALVTQQKKVIVSEMREARGTLHHFLNLAAQQNLGALLSMEPEEINTHEVDRRLVRYAPGFNLLLAPPGHYTLALTADYVEAIMHQLVLKSDYLLLDLPTPPLPNIGPALEKAEHIFLVTEPEPISLKCAAATLKMLDEWGLTNQVKVVTVTRSPAAALIGVNEIQQRLNDLPIVATIPPAAEMLHDAVRVGKPLLELKPKSMPAQAYRNLAKWLIEQQEVLSSTQPVTAPA